MHRPDRVWIRGRHGRVVEHGVVQRATPRVCRQPCGLPWPGRPSGIYKNTVTAGIPWNANSNDYAGSVAFAKALASLPASQASLYTIFHGWFWCVGIPIGIVPTSYTHYGTPNQLPAIPTTFPRQLQRLVAADEQPPGRRQCQLLRRLGEVRQGLGLSRPGGPSARGTRPRSSAATLTDSSRGRLANIEAQGWVLAILAHGGQTRSTLTRPIGFGAARVIVPLIDAFSQCHLIPEPWGVVDAFLDGFNYDGHPHVMHTRMWGGATRRNSRTLSRGRSRPVKMPDTKIDIKATLDQIRAGKNARGTEQ